MKRETTRFSMMAVIIILVTQLYSAVPVAGAFQGNDRPRTTAMRIDPSAQPGRGRGRGRQNWCLRRCRREYSNCLSYAGGNWRRRRACAIRYRICGRRCS